MPFLIQSKGFWPRVEKRLLIALFFLPFGTPDSGSKFRGYEVFIRYHWASASMTKGNSLSKRKRNVLRRDVGSIFIIIPSKYALLTKREVNMTGYLAKFPLRRSRGQYPVILTEQAWSIGFILWQNYRGFDSQRFVLLLFSVLRVGRLPRHWFISFFSITLPSVVCVKAKRYNGPLRYTIAHTHVFRSPNTLETPRNEAVYLSKSSTDIFKTNRNLLSMRCGEKIPAWLVWDQIARVTSRCLEHFGWCACGST